MAVKAQKDETIHITPLKQGTIRLRMIGSTPLYMNRMSEKVMQGFVTGMAKKTAAEKKEIKHHPRAEFRSSAHVVPDGPTLLGIPTISVKAAMSTAALETAGITKAATQRLIRVPAGYFSVWGVPRLKMDVVRSADMAKTPDVRTRCFLPCWCAEIEVSFIAPQFGAAAIVNLLANAGVLVGVGDFRQEKGKGSYGLWRVIGDGQDDVEWDEIVAGGGREAQQAAFDNPEPADEETAALLAYYDAESKRRSA